ncbi:hypothetical protein [Streptacidiphilus cavernicola]|uniref:Uncharacterized protein n=1 Tax=Streptacidiphilus cavernicola TaxID=3342716 RepID=A0ABV6VTD9_9ACTN
MNHDSGAPGPRIRPRIRRDLPRTRGDLPRAPRRGPLPAGRRLGAALVLAAVAATALSGCGIRDTALPVDAGVAASRTACPPAPDATLSKLASDARILPTRPAPPPAPVPVPASEEAKSAAAAAARPTGSPKPGQQKPGQQPRPLATADRATPSPEPSPTRSDGTLSCLHSSAP